MPATRLTPPLNDKARRRHAAMMARGEGQPVDLFVIKQRSTGEVRIAKWSMPARLARAAKILLALWAAGAVSVLVPVAHFVLVPAFLIAGPVAAALRLGQASGVLGGEGTCPACGTAMILEAGADVWPLYGNCPGCGETVRIERRTGEAK